MGASYATSQCVAAVTSVRCLNIEVGPGRGLAKKRAVAQMMSHGKESREKSFHSRSQYPKFNGNIIAKYLSQAPKARALAPVPFELALKDPGNTKEHPLGLCLQQLGALSTPPGLCRSEYVLVVKTG